MISDSELAIRKFKMFAEKADTEEKLIELCKKYLAHKGMNVDETMKQALEVVMRPPEVAQVYVGPGTTQQFIREEAIEKHKLEDLSPGDQLEIKLAARKNAAQKLISDLVYAGFIEFYENFDPVMYQQKIAAKIVVYKDK